MSELDGMCTFKLSVVHRSNISECGAIDWKGLSFGKNKNMA